MYDQKNAKEHETALSKGFKSLMDLATELSECKFGAPRDRVLNQLIRIRQELGVSHSIIVGGTQAYYCSTDIERMKNAWKENMHMTLDEGEQDKSPEYRI